MSLACIACHCLDSPSRSFRSSSVSSSDSEGRCAAIVGCLTQKVTAAAAGGGGSSNSISTSKVAPFPIMASGQGIAGAPRLLRSRAVTRDHVRDWNFDEFPLEL